MPCYPVDIGPRELKWLVHVNRRHGATVLSSEGRLHLRQIVDVPEAVADQWRADLLSIEGVRISDPISACSTREAYAGSGTSGPAPGSVKS